MKVPGKKFGAILAGIFTASALTLVVTPTASASYSQCPAGYFCMWENSSYTGMFYASPGSVSNVGGFNDKATSFWNRTNTWVTAYANSNYGTYSECSMGGCLGTGCAAFGPGSSSAAIPSSSGISFNDKVSSFRVGERNTSCYIQIS